MKALKIFLVFVFLAFSVVVSVSNTRKVVATTPETLLASPDKTAREIYAQNCARCHGADGRGDTELGRKYDVPDLADKDWQRYHSNKKIVERITRGGDGMPAFGKKLSPAEIQMLVRHVRSLRK